MQCSPPVHILIPNFLIYFPRLPLAFFPWRAHGCYNWEKVFYSVWTQTNWLGVKPWSHTSSPQSLENSVSQSGVFWDPSNLRIVRDHHTDQQFHSSESEVLNVGWGILLFKEAPEAPPSAAEFQASVQPELFCGLLALNRAHKISGHPGIYLC